MVVPVSVQEVMSGVETAPPDGTADAVARRFVESGHELIVVVDDGEPIGMRTRSDFVSLIASNEPMTQTTREFMSEPLRSIEPSTSVHEAAAIRYEHQISQLPVLDDGRLLGLVTATDFSHFVTNATMNDGVSTPTLESITREKLEWSSEYDEDGLPVIRGEGVIDRLPTVASGESE